MTDSGNDRLSSWAAKERSRPCMPSGEGCTEVVELVSSEYGEIRGGLELVDLELWPETGVKGMASVELTLSSMGRMNEGELAPD